MTLRWQKRKMPLKIHLPRPPADFVDDPEAVWDSVRDGVPDWTDVAAPGIPSFVFVDEPGDADIPIVWERKSLGGDRWYIAYAAADIDVFAQRFGIAHILVTARRQNGSEPSLGILYETVLHEMGHALGLAGHSPEQGDIMYPRIMGGRDEGLSARDRETLRLLYKRPNGHRVAGARRAD
ncbi:MAG: matrixin family metalloprotease [bacterium]|nr:matrixin family metalloprotease [bacterium]